MTRIIAKLLPFNNQQFADDVVWIGTSKDIVNYSGKPSYIKISHGI
jgi:hypothetical protein